MANLICGNDPRERSHTFKNSEYAKVYQRIRDAVARSDIKFDGQLSVKSKIDAKFFFKWAAKEYLLFAKNLPDRMMVSHATLNIIETGADKFSGEGFSIPSNFEQLKKSYSDLKRDHSKLTEKCLILQDEVNRLLVVEKKER